LASHSPRYVFATGSSQGDQIGRFFAHWTTVYFGQLFENYKSSTNSWAACSRGKIGALILTKKWVGLPFGAIFSLTHLVTLEVAYMRVLDITVIISPPYQQNTQSRPHGLLTQGLFTRKMILQSHNIWVLQPK
jgi:hypothetical protein